MRFRFSKKITTICSLLILGMLYASYWQWGRHQNKLAYIQTLQDRLEKPVNDISEILDKNTDFEQIPFRRFKIEGEYDFTREVTLRNRRLNDIPGVFVITPLKIKNSSQYILVSRGFIPITHATKDKRTIFQRPAKTEFVGLMKSPQTPKMFAPSDPSSGPNLPWVDTWLRIDIANISKQLPYPVLPVFAEVMSGESTEEAKEKIIVSKSDKNDLFFLANKSAIPGVVKEEDLDKYPIAVFDTVIPPGRHLGYVFEWASMALMTFFIGLILQFRRPRLAQE